MNGWLRSWIVGVSAVAVVASIGAGIGVATAADESENIIKYRQNVMRSQGAHLGAISGVIKGEVSFTGHLAGHADALVATSKLLLDIFPEGSLTGAETRAKPEIWQDWDSFGGKVTDLQAATVNLASVVNGGGDLAAVEAAFGEVGKACGGCHRTFREKTD